MKVDTACKRTVFLMGDSLIEDYSEEKLPLCGWGKYFSDYVKDGVVVKNYSHSGWTTQTFLTADHSKLYPGKSCWDVLIEDVGQGDWVIICLGVNDASLVNPLRTSEEQYRRNLGYFADEIRKKGADVIFGTLSVRGGDDNSELGWNYTLAPDGVEPDMDQRWIRRANVLCEIARDLNVEVFQFGKELQKVYENMYQDYMASHPGSSVAEGRNYVRYYFHLYNKAINTPVEEGGLGFDMPDREDDSTHLNKRGAMVYARVAAELISKSDTELAKLIDMASANQR